MADEVEGTKEQPEEIKEETSAETPVEASQSEASKDSGGAPSGDAKAEKKAKKVNRLSAADLDKKIEEFENSNQTQSVYYKHLVMRKKEIQGSDAV